MTQERLTDCQPWIRMGLKPEEEGGKDSHGAKRKGNWGKLYFIAHAWSPPPSVSGPPLSLLSSAWAHFFSPGRCLLLCMRILLLPCSLGTQRALPEWAAVPGVGGGGMGTQAVILATFRLLWHLWRLLNIAGFLLFWTTWRLSSCFLYVTLLLFFPW